MHRCDGTEALSMLIATVRSICHAFAFLVCVDVHIRDVMRHLIPIEVPQTYICPTMQLDLHVRVNLIDVLPLMVGTASYANAIANEAVSECVHISVLVERGS